jgi:hypothetical protein
MTVGVAVVELHVHGSRSLKQKRGVVKSIAQRLRNRFNLSVSEVGGHDTWQRAVLGLAVAGNDERSVRTSLERALAFVEDLHLAEVTGQEVDVLALPLAEGCWDPESSPDEELEGPGE